MPARFPGFPPEALAFLRDLDRNNDRDWFQPRKAIYDEKVKQPLCKLVEALNDDLARFAADYRTDASKAVYRIYRDTRFSNDKTPYKTHASASFYNRSLGKHVAACYYFHVSPRELLIGGGLWAPGARELLAVRRRISEDPGALRSILADKTFRGLLGAMTGERLKRPPKGFSADDPALDLLLHEQFLAAAQLDPQLIESSRGFQEIAKRFQAITPFIAFLNGAIEGR